MATDINDESEPKNVSENNQDSNNQDSKDKE